MINFKKPLFVQFISFTSAGAMGTLVQYAMLFIFVEALAMYPVAASTLGALAGAIINYLLSHHWVFQSKRSHSKTLSKFFVISGLGLALNATIMYVMVTVISAHYLLAQVAATSVVLFWNFLGNRFWTFADETRNT